MNQTIDQSLLPNRLRESTFRKYEVYIATATTLFPKKLEVKFTDIKDLSVTTFIARLRDSFSSLHEYRWPTTLIDMVKFDKHFPKLRKVRQAFDKIYIGGDSLDEPIEPFAIPCPPPSALSSPTIHLSTFEEQKLVCELASYRLLKNPLKVSGISPDTAKWLQENFDVRIDPNPDGTDTIQ